MALTLVADDLTGACDTGALFAGGGRVSVLVWGTSMDGADHGAHGAVALDTESREAAPGEAAARCRAMAGPWVAPGAGRRLFKKIDSTMRGPIGAELDALLDVSGLAGALVCPSFPAQGRTVVGGELRVDGVAAHRSAIGRDPGYPGATSDLRDILARQCRRAVRHLALHDVRGDGAVTRALDAARDALLVADAERGEDLDALARAALARPGLLVAGSAGLGRAVATALGLLAGATLPARAAWLVVAGSQHPATRAQVAALRHAGVAGASIDEADGAGRLTAALRAGRPAFLTTPDAPAADRAEVAARTAARVADVLALARPGLLALVGGQTAHAVLRRLDARRLDLAGAPADGLAAGELSLAAGPPLPVLTKAGGFGPPELFVDLLRGGAA